VNIGRLRRCFTSSAAILLISSVTPASLSVAVSVFQTPQTPSPAPPFCSPGPRPPTTKLSTSALPADVAPICRILSVLCLCCRYSHLDPHVANLAALKVSAQCFGCSSLDLGLLCLLELVHTDILYRGHSSNLCGRHRVVNTGKRVHSEVNRVSAHSACACTMHIRSYSSSSSAVITL
jgi:hypothetical protein